MPVSSELATAVSSCLSINVQKDNVLFYIFYSRNCAKIVRCLMEMSHG